jgi:phospholipid transport system substrate-binding protein
LSGRAISRVCRVEEGDPESMFPSLTRAVAVLSFAVIALAVAPVRAAEPAPVVETFYATLLDVMKNADKLGFRGREQKLAPAIDKAYDLPLMARLSVGPQWQKLSPDEQQKITAGFRQMTIATYANRFDGYSGEKFEVEKPAVDASGGKLVQTKLIKSDGEVIQLNYLMRETGGEWKVIDVFLKGTVSELATRRSEFTSVLRRDGAQGLVKLLADKTAAEAKG